MGFLKSVFNLLPYSFTEWLHSLVLSQGTKLSQQSILSTLPVPFLTLNTVIMFFFKCLLPEMNNPNHFNLLVHGFSVLLIIPVASLSILTTSVLYHVLLADGAITSATCFNIMGT